MTRVKIAFFVYAHNLAETTRGIEVAKKLRQKGADIRFYSHGGPHEGRISEAKFRYTRIEPTMTSDHHRRFLDIDHGRTRGALYSEKEWYDFAQSEIKALRDFAPAALYAGFNLPSVISARAVGIPLIYLIPTQGTLTYMKHGLGVFPEFLENPVTRLLPQKFKNRIFNFILQRFNYIPLGAINRAAVALGAKPLKSSFEVISGDLVLLSDLPEITGLPAAALPSNHHYIGPLFADLPLKIQPEVRRVFQRPGLKIFCAMGSSGTPEVMRMALNTLKRSSYNVIGATTSIIDPEEFAPFSERFFVTRYVPAAPVNEMADIAVTHGGQGTLQNSCWAGKPVVATPFQFEQQSNIEMLVRAGSAIKIPLYKFNEKNLLQAIEQMANTPAYFENAIKLKAVFRRADGAARAADLILAFLKRDSRTAPSTTLVRARRGKKSKIS